MILEALTQYYETMVSKGEIDAPGWSLAKVSFALRISPDGELLQVLNIQKQEERKKKLVMVPQQLSLPAPVKRSVGILPNFLCDNSGYLLGVDAKGKPERTKDCFAASKELHEKILKDVESPVAKAVLAFFAKWDPVSAGMHPALKDCLEEILAGGNLVFLCDAQYAHLDGPVRAAWNAYYGQAEDEEQTMICMVTGERTAPAKIHPSIKGVAGAQPSGAALVSFNAPSFCSYGREQNLNAPTGKYAAFAYTAALNHLLADFDHIFRVGDTTLVCWAKSAEPEYEDFLGEYLWGEHYSLADMQDILKKFSKGEKASYSETMLDPNMEFYILGLSPNAARISVRLFLKNSFGQFVENIEKHYERLEIVKPQFDPYPTIPLWRLLSETVNQNSRDKSPKPGLSGECLRAILENTRYPATLLNGVNLRIRADREINRTRAAILKAYYLKNPHPDLKKEEVLTVSYNPASESIPYQLGALFAVLEMIQEEANPGINTTIKDRFFNSASATPACVFPTLVKLAQKHLKKVRESGRQIWMDKQLTELLGKLGEALPKQLNIPQQGAFQLGYYQYKQTRYQKKEEK